MVWSRNYIGNKDRSQAGVVIIGAGISGICTAIDLLNKNIHNFVILEKSGGLGGTWRDNAYPGCCCDIFSHLYSFSFEQNPGWTRLYPAQEEILDYLVRVAEKYGLYRYIRFNTAVDEARWDNAERKWRTKIRVEGSKDSEFGSEYTITSDFLVSAVGQLNQPAYPSIPGLDDFGGKAMHSARWDWTYDYDGKRIGIIGNGATSVQIVPEVAKVASHLTVFQRTPNWVVPRFNLPVPKALRALLRYVPPIQWRLRADMMYSREAFYDALVRTGTVESEWARNFALDNMKKYLPDQPEMWKKLTPDYPPGCKRILISDDYYQALTRDNVSLETGAIDRITEKGVVVDGVEQEFDVLVLATGFRTVEFMHPINVIGDDGRTLNELWQGSPRALYGIAVESLPNFGMLYGPNTNLGHNSIILMIESQARYIGELASQVLRAHDRGQTLVLTPKKERIDDFNAELQKELASSSFADPHCRSWYKNKEGIITNNWSRRVVDYQKLLAKLCWRDYEISGDGAEGLRTRTATHLGRVREEPYVSWSSIGLTALSVMAVAGGLALKAPHLLPHRLLSR